MLLQMIYKHMTQFYTQVFFHVALTFYSLVSMAKLVAPMFFEESAHMPHIEEERRYLEVTRKFL